MLNECISDHRNKKTMPQPKFDTKINCLEQLKDEISVILEVDPTIFSTFFSLISNVYININKFKKWVISQNDY